MVGCCTQFLRPPCLLEEAQAAVEIQASITRLATDYVNDTDTNEVYLGEVLFRVVFELLGFLARAS